MKRVLPKRSLRSEAFPLVTAIMTMVAAFALIPRESVFFSPSPVRVREPVCAFITLSPEDEAHVLKSARTAWQIDRSANGRPRAELVALDPSDDLDQPMISFDAGVLSAAVLPAIYQPDILPPTEAASAPALISPDRQPADASTFSRADLLTL